MPPTLADHIFAGVLVIGIPLYAAVFAWPRMKARLASDDPGVRPRTYWLNIVLLWLLATAAMTIWQKAGRSPAELGFEVVAGWRFWTALAVALVLGGLLTVQYRLALRSPKTRRKLRRQFDQAAAFVPRNRREMTHFAALSLTAGICEEILYRGFLIWYVAQFTGFSLGGLAAAVTLAAIVFGVSHLYQGPKNASQIFGLAIVMGVLYVLSESLWIVMALHAYIDVAGGLVCTALYEQDEPAAPHSPSRS